MKVEINNVPSCAPDKVSVRDATKPEVVLITEHTSDDKTYIYALSKELILRLPEHGSGGAYPEHEPVQLPGGYRWLTPEVVQKLKELVR